MEQWIEIFAQSISSIDEDERNEANQNLLDHIQSLNPDFIKNSCLVLIFVLDLFSYVLSMFILSSHASH